MPKLALHKPVQALCIVYAVLVGLGATELFYFWGVLVTLPWSMFIPLQAPWGVLLGGFANITILLVLSAERAQPPKETQA
jgi:hypothetical protein